MIDNLKTLGAFTPSLERRTFRAGTWAGGEVNGDVMNMPWFNRGPDMEAFVDACYPLMATLKGTGFDWTKWIHTEDANRVQGNLDQATVEELAQYVTALIRQERFVEGLVASAYEKGDFLRIAKRAEVLSQAS